MGIIPKKERRKKAEPVTLPDAGKMSALSGCRPLNGCLSDLTKQGDYFSASKLFPELAGKLSLDNHKNNDLTSAESLAKPSSKTSPKQGASAPHPKRARRPTRRSLSILRKKHLGLLTDEQAKASFTAAGYKTYSHYAAVRLAESELLTTVIDNSDDETFTSARLHSYSCSGGGYNPLSPQPGLNYSSDLNSDLSEYVCTCFTLTF